MSEPTGRHSWSAAVWVLIVLVVGLVVGAGLAISVHVPQNPGPPGPPGPAPPPVAVTQTSVLLSTVCLTLLAALVLVYGRNYLATRAPYVLGLLIFLTVLFVTTAVNSPLLFTAFGIGPGNLGRFLVVSELLLSAALSIFLYLSLQ
jgi:hypothetical protein